MFSNPNLLFFLAVLSLGIVLRFFYIIQRRLFVSSYYSFYELITRLPVGLTWTQIFLVRFLPPFVIGFLSFLLLNNLFQKQVIYYSLIGGISSLINILPAVARRAFNKDNEIKNISVASLLAIYLLYLLSFSLLSLLGAHVASGYKDDLVSFLPSKGGIVDGVWVALIIIILRELNKPAG